jgi:hypothetical protein
MSSLAIISLTKIASSNPRLSTPSPRTGAHRGVGNDIRRPAMRLRSRQVSLSGPAKEIYVLSGLRLWLGYENILTSNTPPQGEVCIRGPSVLQYFNSQLLHVQKIIIEIFFFLTILVSLSDFHISSEHCGLVNDVTHLPGFSYLVAEPFIFLFYWRSCAQRPIHLQVKLPVYVSQIIRTKPSRTYEISIRVR